MRWQTVAGYTYISICIFDFVIVPVWFGLVRAQLDPFDLLEKVLTLDVAVQVRLIEAFTFQHNPFTLQGGGLFHLAFGALLTGSTIFSNK